jgi:hypothetical protein
MQLLGSQRRAAACFPQEGRYSPSARLRDPGHSGRADTQTSVCLPQRAGRIRAQESVVIADRVRVYLAGNAI